MVGETADREIVVETTTVRATFTNRGGRLLHWVLKEYRNDNGEPLDLVPQTIGPDAVKPFSLVVDDPARDASGSTTDFIKVQRRRVTSMPPRRRKR